MLIEVSEAAGRDDIAADASDALRKGCAVSGTVLRLFVELEGVVDTRFKDSDGAPAQGSVAVAFSTELQVTREAISSSCAFHLTRRFFCSE